ncbi:hypothetical protein H9N25_19685 [Pedobacter riviphilus]|uniref:YDG domain-containing protein n=2 Tax=Pedobacter riviphilus TaxID=2766984 RepID=A0ABX6TP40_9SPHI|nr:hypothetical protein H9N25_19685 [Pedobacter riviphilus]
MPELADALIAARNLNMVAAGAVKQIWVAGGTYKPLYNPADNDFGNPAGRDNAFLLVKDVKLYGGFAGTETMLANRNLTLTSNKSILSGDIDNNDALTDNLSTTINGNNSYHVVVSAAAMGAAELNGFTITGGSANTNSFTTVNGELITRNNGGALYNINATLALSNLIIAYNKASFEGAGIYNYNKATVNASRTSITNNTATVNGGGIFSDSFGSSLNLSNMIVGGNNTNGNGGGICDYSISGSSNFTNLLVYGNTAGSLGGGMYLSSATTTLTNLSIVANTSITGGGLHNERQSPVIYNSIIFGNNSGINNNNSTPVIKNSLVQGLSSTANGNINATGVLINNLFMTPLSAGLSTGGDYRLKAGSPGINAGDKALFTGLDANTTDLDGNARLNGTQIDLGAYESQGNSAPIPDGSGIVYVKQGGAGTYEGNSWANAAPELSDALLATKNNIAIKQIWVAGGTYKPLYSPADNNFGASAGRDNAFLLVKDVKLYGGFAGTETTLAQRDLTLTVNKSTLSGDFNNDDVISGVGATLNFANNSENAYHVLISAGDVGLAELDGFTIKGGNGSGGSITVNALAISKNQGGGINITSSSPTITNCIFENNNVSTGMGGAIFTSAPANGAAASPVIAKSSFVNNKCSNIAGQGWGDEGGGAMYNTGSGPVISDCSFMGNLVTGSRFGGAIANMASTAQFSNVTISNNFSLGTSSGGGGIANISTGTVRLINVVLSGNSTDANGGAMYNSFGAIPMLINVLISGNAANNGAGIYNNNSSPVLTNVTIGGNLSNTGGVIFNTNSASPQVQNTIVFGNSAGIVNNTGTDVPIYKNSLVQGASGAGLIAFNGTATDLFVSPSVPALTAAGDYRPKTGAALINAGDQNLFSGLNANTKDLDGNPRLTGTNIDLGAYEALVQLQTITAHNLSKTYGDLAFEPGATASSGLTVAYVSADNSIAEAFQDATDGNKWKLNIKKAGTVNITASQPGNGAYSPAPNVVFSLTIGQRPVTVSLKSTAALTKTYDANTAGMVQVTDLELSIGDIINNDDVQLSLNSGMAQYNSKDAGTGKTITLPIANVLLTGAQAGNYKVANISDLSSSAASITPKPLTITANNFSKVYNGLGYSGGNGVSYGTFALGEDPSVLSGTLSFGGTAQGAINTGNYTIVPRD